MKKEYETIDEALKNNFNTNTNNKALILIEELKDVKSKGYFTRVEFLKMCMWKSPRPKKFYLENSEDTIQNVSRIALAEISENVKIELLTSLRGVSIPVGSAILTLIEPQNYGVIDIRVWQTLHTYGLVNTKPQGRGFTTQDWITYLEKLRELAHKLKTSVRDIEINLFFYHKKIQEGNLYTKGAA
ncbi:MAG: hypothetical protein WC595_05740 [Candidatus Nanoarchaeia archaeon]